MSHGATTTSAEPAAAVEPTRRWIGLGMVAGLVAAYGTLAAFIGRFLYPAAGRQRSWLYVSDAGRLVQGDALLFRTPAGEPVNVTRQGAEDDSIVALSSTCPHLGCQVHWEPQNDRFFCPCHNGVFDPSGKAISGPPADAGQSLLQYPVRVDRGMLFIEVPTDQLALGPGCIEDPATERSRRPPGPGHDPCLYTRPELVTLQRPGERTGRHT
ncbi:MAG TPA: Rieske (2Fe-2S) protein [Thermoanaerobaculia bacterium]|nr:Rieske (2Fe-2S) protein [Thermoanaerobaculia bacterium]